MCVVCVVCEVCVCAVRGVSRQTGAAHSIAQILIHSYNQLNLIIATSTVGFGH